ncbi:MAG: GHKL domain-containing protein [Nitrospirae bacterium]|nr:GHKL domain-containing protein [Nitrospirota bacterium]
MGHDFSYKKITDLFLRRRFQIGIIFLLPIFFAIFAAGPYFIALEKFSRLLEKDVILKEELKNYNSFIQKWAFISFGVAILSGLAVAYSLLIPAKRLLKASPSLEVPSFEDFNALGKEFTTIASSLHQYISTLDSMAGGVITMNENGTVTMANAQASTILGLRTEEIVGLPLSAVIPELRWLSDESLKGSTISSGEIPVSIGGKPAILGYSLTPIRELRKIKGSVLSFKDITKLKDIHMEIQRTERLASLGALAAEIAHEVRNPLGSIKGLVELIKEDLKGEDPRHEYLKVILNEIDRLNRAVEGLLDYTKPMEKTEIRLEEVLHRAVLVSKLRFKDKAVNIIEEYDKVMPLPADEGKICQAFLNLIINACEAVKAGSEIHIRCKNLDTDVVVEISNPYTHAGDVTKFFDSYYTTKAGGAGLGLKISREIIENHGGSLNVRHEGGLIIFSATFPLPISHLTVEERQNA